MKTKKLLLMIALSTILIATLNSCILSFGGTKTTTVSTQTQVSALAMHLISSAQAKVLSKEYAEHNYKLVNAGKIEPETKEVYYDIEDLEDYIKYVKEQAKKNKIENVGITIAFGQYPKTALFDKRLKENYKGQQTVYLKATTKSMPSQKVGMGGFAKDESNAGIDDISAFDFGQLTPPER